MPERRWRNPYAPISKKTGRPTGVATGSSLALTPNKQAAPPLDLRTSVSRMRSNIKGISSTIRQMEETMDTIYGAIEMLDSLGKKMGVTRLKSVLPQRTETGKADPAPEQEATGNNPLGNLDIGQLFGILQSPLVQNLLQQSAGGGTNRKKEG